MYTYSLRLDENTEKKLKAICEEKDRSINKQIIQIIKNYIKEYEKINGVILIKEK